MKRFLAVLLVIALVFATPMTSTYAKKSKTKLNKKKITLTVGKTYKLKVKKKPAGKKVKWKSSNKKVATVSKKGKVKAKKKGKATITAKIGKKKYKCKVTVKAKKSPVVTTKPVATTKKPVVTTTESVVTTKTPQESTMVTTERQTTTNPVITTKAPATEAPTTTKAPATEAPTQPANIDWSKVAYLADGAEGGKLSNVYKVYCSDDKVQVVNIQKDADGETVIYVTFPIAVSKTTFDGAKIQGAGVGFPVSKIQNGETTVTVTDADNNNYVLVIYKAGSSDNPAQPTQPTQPQDTTEDPVTTKAVTGNVPAKPAGLTYAGNTDLPYYFAWAAQNDAESYNFYVNDVKIGTSTSSSYNAIEYFETVNAGIYTIAVTAVNANGESEKSSIQWEKQGAATQTTEKPVITTKDVTAPGQTDKPGTESGESKVPSIDKWNTYPDGATVNGNGISADLPAYTGGNPWDSQMTTNGLLLENGKTYKITVTLTSSVSRKFQVVLQSDGADQGNWSYLTQDVFSVEADKAYTYTKTITASNIQNNYLLGIMMGYVDNTASPAGKVTVTEAKLEEVSGSQTPSADVTTTTKKSEDTSIDVSDATWIEIGSANGITYSYNSNKTVKEVVSIQKPGFATEEGIYVTVNSGISSVTVNGNDAGYSKDGAGVIIHLSALTQELNTVVITHAEGTSTVVLKKGAGTGSNNPTNPGQQQTTIKNEEGSVYMPRTTAPTTKAVEDNTQPTQPVNFTVDSGLEQPFGVDLHAASTPGYLTVVWGAGNPNCYNVYVDGERRRTGVAAQSLTLPVYTEGPHTVKIATVSGLKESIPWEGTVTVSGTGEKETEEPKVPSSLQPKYNQGDIQSGKFMIQINNNSNGAWSDDEVYWCIVGLNSSNQYVYVERDGSLRVMTQDLNNITVNNRRMANLCHKVSECNKIYLTETLSSARIFVSYEKPVYLGVNDGGYAAPNLGDSSDPNFSTLYEFEEFTLTKTSNTSFNYWGNTTRVDYFAFPTITRLVGGNTYYGYDKTVGDTIGRQEAFDIFYATAPTAFKTLVNSLRIMAPCKTTFDAGQRYGNYFDSYINEFWTKYASQDLVVNTEQGSYVGRVINNRLQMRANGQGTVYYIDKPTTQDVLEGKGTLHMESAENRGTAAGGVELAIQAQICAAFNRGVATTPENWFKPSAYYKNDINNFYAGFTHKYSVNGYAYGFCYDDVNDQSTLLQNNDAKALIIDTRW